MKRIGSICYLYLLYDNEAHFVGRMWAIREDYATVRITQRLTACCHNSILTDIYPHAFLWYLICVYLGLLGDRCVKLRVDALRKIFHLMELPVYYRILLWISILVTGGWVICWVKSCLRYRYGTFCSRWIPGEVNVWCKVRVAMTWA